MSQIHDKLTEDFCRALNDVVQTSVRQTLESMFGCRIEVSGNRDSDDDQAVVASVEFQQGIESITLQLIFERSFLYSLVLGYYPGAEASVEDNDVCIDATCELANIIFHKVKYFMNSNGFLFHMNLPVASTYAEARAMQKDNRIVALSFSMSDNGAVGGNVLRVNIN